MAKIKKLDKHLMNMIAAGEVVERPAGIVKELVDNAIDANASLIEVEVTSGGIDLIRVTDNGVGMSKEDAILAFERHATSKIENEVDLWSINTLGFRGEALPSIASVSKVSLITSDGNNATQININYGDMDNVSKVGSNVGSSISISGLFYRTPARLKNFSSVNYEMTIITSYIEKFALAYPQISFILKNEERIVFQTSGNNDISEVIYQIYGKVIAQDSIIFSDKDNDFEVSGALVLPDHTRSNRNHIMLFINDRMIRSYRLTNDVIKGYEKYLFSDRFPIAIIKLKMDNQLVDVNVHPTKWEVKVSKNRQLSALIKASVDKALGQNMQAPKIRKVSSKEEVEQSELNFSKRKPLEKNGINPKVDEAYLKYDMPLPIYEKAETKEEVISDDIEDILRLHLIGQMHGKYILAQDHESLYIIDQHAAEERVNFERINHKLKNNIIETTPLLVPERIEIKPSIMPLIKEMLLKMDEIGLSVEVFGSDSIVVREIPLWLMDADIGEFVNKLIEYLTDNTDVDINYLRKDVIATMACHSSIRFNKNLSEVEMQQVLDNLSQTKQPYHCPHGRPTLIKITEKQLIKEFLR